MPAAKPPFPPSGGTSSPGDPRGDEELVEASRAGDRAALEALLRRHAPMMHRVCRRITGNDDDAADAFQQAMIAIVRSLDRFDGLSRFSTWVYRVTTNASLDELRRRRRRPEPVDIIPDHPAEGRTAGWSGAWNGPLDGAVADRLDVDAALARLPADFRAAVVLRDLCRLDYAEIAEVLGVPIGTVRSRIARGRSALVPLLSCGDEGRPPPGNRSGPGGRPTGRP